MKNLVALVLSSSLAAASWDFHPTMYVCDSGTCDLLSTTMDSAVSCVDKCNAKMVMMSQHVTVPPTLSTNFDPYTNCTVQNGNVQVFDTADFFVHFPANVGHIEAFGDITATFADTPTSTCKLTVEFLPKAVTDCKAPKTDNYPFATQTITPGATGMPIVQIFQNLEGKAALVTANDWAACGGGLSKMSYDMSATVTLNDVTSGAVASIAVGGVVAAAVAMLW